MQVGKKYRRQNGDLIWIVTGVTPRGNVVVESTDFGGERILQKQFFDDYTEVKEPIVRYVHWLRRKGGDKLGDELWVFLNTDPMAYQVHLDRYDHLHTEKVEYVG